MRSCASMAKPKDHETAPPGRVSTSAPLQSGLASPSASPSAPLLSGTVPRDEEGSEIALRALHRSRLEHILRQHSQSLPPPATALTSEDEPAPRVTKRVPMPQVTDLTVFHGRALASELAAWGDLLEVGALRPYSGERWHALYALGFGKNIELYGIDGAWAAAFCGCAPLFDDREHVVFAALDGASDGTGSARVYELERGSDALVEVQPSISAWLAARNVVHAEPQRHHITISIAPSPVVDDTTLEMWPDPTRMWKRSRWLRQLIANRTATPPVRAKLEEQRADDARHLHLPHVCAYWVLAFAVLDDARELEGLLRLMPARYAALEEITEVGRAVLGGRPVTASWWPEQEVRALRAARAPTPT